MSNIKIRKWDEIKGMPIEGYEKRINVDEVTSGEQIICRNPIKTVEELVEQNCNYIDGVINNEVPVTNTDVEKNPENKSVSVMEQIQYFCWYKKHRREEARTLRGRFVREII